jgi:predicted kinase
MAPPLLGGGMEIVLSRGISVRLGGVVDREQLRSVVEVLLESQRC